MFKCFCDKKDCGKEIEEREGFGTFTLVSRQTIFDSTNHKPIPQMKKEEFHLCEEHAKLIEEFLKEKNKTEVD